MSVDKNVLLQDAERAYHALMTGQSVAELRDHNGELVRYFAPQASRLRAYIETLKSELGLIRPGSNSPACGWF